MKWLGAALLLSLAIPTIVRTAPPETRLLRQPDVSKDSVVFVYAEDLWLAPRSGGQARRLTSHPQRQPSSNQPNDHHRTHRDRQYSGRKGRAGLDRGPRSVD